MSTLRSRHHHASTSNSNHTTTASPGHRTPGTHTFILPSPHNLGHHVLGYHIAGATSGSPIFFFHGLPSSRREADDFHATAVQQNLCIIGVDRPGVGLSTFRPGYGLLDWPRDVHALATYLGHDSFRVLGGSGGGPYALACAYALPKEVLKGTGVLAGLAPREAGYKGVSWERYIGFTTNKWLPYWLLHFVIDSGLARHARNPDQTHWRKIIVDGMVKRLPATDQALFDDTAIEAMASQIRDACLGGADGYVQDAKCVLGKWPFDVGDVRGKVGIWNGTADTDTPVQGARWMAGRIPGARLREFEGDSHFSIFVKRQEGIFKELMAL